ncbi:hypothetical protein SAMN05216522_110145 [Rosenbergiella nectarea]|uniref:PLD-like domain-containing protein n=1 Tax=Rosenbergiella nectarea TaxID=988801 RepID=A0A1H9L2Z4_9GAMM|nr:phospholipase D family protein [Rosenbergiella nectarea]SER05688.1 hypothetical protein SAMN05216522_110145 [Rosenbergiella nectarea]
MADYRFYLQNPASKEGNYLVDEILFQSKGAKKGGAHFAFMSSSGIDLLFKDERFISFIKDNHFFLTVGVDAITDEKALNEILKFNEKYANLVIKFFITEAKNSIFHPKFIWFQKEKHYVHIVGSGNLTAGGLRWNVEAYSTYICSVEKQNEIYNWEKFLTENTDFLFDHDNERVKLALKRNTENRKILAKIAKDKSILLDEDTVKDEIPEPHPDNTILIAEISKNGDRLQQVNFDKDNFFNFFDATTVQDEATYNLFFQVNKDGLMQEKEIRPAVVVKSHNYRFELNAVKGMKYPEEGKPIGVFLKIAAKSFLYMVVLPTENAHSVLDEFLTEKLGISSNRMRRIRIKAEEIRTRTPDLPIWVKTTLADHI